MSDSELTKPCSCCGGSGLVPDPAKIGAVQKQLRKSSGVTLKELTDQAGFSIGYWGDLENGRPGKKWNDELVKKHSDGVKAVKKKLKAK